MTPDSRPLRVSDIMTTRSLLDEGLTPAGLTSRLRRGDLLRVARGNYVEARRWAGYSDAERAVARHVAHLNNARSDILFSHTSAALLHGLSFKHLPGDIHVSGDPRPFPESKRIVGHLLSDAHQYREILQGRIPVTSLQRTALDCTISLPLADGIVVMDQLLARGVDRTALLEGLETPNRLKGRPMARRVIQFADARSGSVLESLGRVALSRMNIPMPTPQLPVRTRAGTKYLDFGWPQYRLGLELDGKQKYFDYRPTQQVVYEEREREKLIVAAGIMVLRAGWNEVVHHSDQLEARINEAIELRRGQLGL